jgi:DNA polymerase-3 subunit chi
MTRIDFYILPQDDEHSRLLYACRLAEKAWQQGNRIHIHTASSAMAQAMDELLWTFRPEAFLPHNILPASQHSPIHIGSGDDVGTHHDLLINLTDSIPAMFSRFERVAEIVTQQPEPLAASRERFKFYREQGYALDSHTIGKRT